MPKSQPMFAVCPSHQSSLPVPSMARPAPPFPRRPMAHCCSLVREFCAVGRGAAVIIRNRTGLSFRGVPRMKGRSWVRSRSRHEASWMWIRCGPRENFYGAEDNAPRSLGLGASYEQTESHRRGTTKREHHTLPTYTRASIVARPLVVVLGALGTRTRPPSAKGTGCLAHTLSSLVHRQTGSAIPSRDTAPCVSSP